MSYKLSYYICYKEGFTQCWPGLLTVHYNDVIMSAVTSQITSVSIICSAVGSDADQRKHQSSASLAFVWGIHWWPMNFSYKRAVTRKMFPFDHVIMKIWNGNGAMAHIAILQTIAENKKLHSYLQIGIPVPGKNCWISDIKWLHSYSIMLFECSGCLKTTLVAR